MQRSMKNIICLLIFSLLFPMPAMIPRLRAQQSANPSSKTAPASAISIDELKSRRIAIESRTDIDTTVKTDSLKYIDGAISFLELAESLPMNWVRN